MAKKGFSFSKTARRVGGDDDRLAGQQAGVSVVGVQSISLPRIVTEHDVGAELADLGDHLDRLGEGPHVGGRGAARQDGDVGAEQRAELAFRYGD